MNQVKKIRKMIKSFDYNDDNLEEICNYYNLINECILPVIKQELKIRVVVNKTNVVQTIKNYAEYCKVRDEFFNDIISYVKISEDYMITN